VSSLFKSQATYLNTYSTLRASSVMFKSHVGVPKLRCFSYCTKVLNFTNETSFIVQALLRFGSNLKVEILPKTSNIDSQNIKLLLVGEKSTYFSPKKKAYKVLRHFVNLTFCRCHNFQARLGVVGREVIKSWR